MLPPVVFQNGTAPFITLDVVRKFIIHNLRHHFNIYRVQEKLKDLQFVSVVMFKTHKHVAK